MLKLTSVASSRRHMWLLRTLVDQANKLEDMVYFKV